LGRTGKGVRALREVPPWRHLLGLTPRRIPPIRRRPGPDRPAKDPGNGNGVFTFVIEA